MESAHTHPALFVRQSDLLPPKPGNGAIRLVFLSDTHGRHEDIALPLPEGDVLFHLGDACHKGNLAQMRSFVQWMKEHSSHKERIVIDGNHDRDLDGQSKRDFMAEYEGVARVLKDEVLEVAGGKMTVLGVTWDACEAEHFVEAKTSIQRWNESIGDRKNEVDLVLTHYHPRVEGGGRGWQGSRLLSQFIQSISPSLHCFGHVHYARGIRALSDPSITMVNCASTWDQPVVIDYCPISKRALMIWIPIPEEALSHLSSSKFPYEWMASAEK